jgi:oligoribonuclease NrnB/cAMP/cGMP phosphodiesterase (DHH superfamily)
MIHVVYHNFCLDGFTAAYVIRKWLWDKQEPESNINFVPANHGDNPPDVSKGDTVYIVDFSYPLSVLNKMKDEVGEEGTVLVLDHHKTAMNDLSSFSNCIFDMERSGCSITWDYFYPNTPKPKLIKHMEDRDLWRFNLVYTKEVFDLCASYPYNFSAWEYLEERLEYYFNECVTEGRAIARYQQQVITNAINNNLIVIDGVPYLNTGKEFGSDACHRVIKKLKVPFSIYYNYSQDKTYFGIRGDGNTDVSAIAKLFGGGGHHSAAGWSFNDYISPKQMQEMINDSGNTGRSDAS